MDIVHGLDNYGHVIVPVLVFHPIISKRYVPMRFLIDTGASKTTILHDDAFLLKIDFSKLKKDKAVKVVGSSINPYKLDDITIVFLEKNTKKKIPQTLKRIHVIKPPEGMTEDDLSYPVNLIGVDLLRRFHFEYSNPQTKLELKKKYYPPSH